jgi:hypothetical protein
VPQRRTLDSECFDPLVAGENMNLQKRSIEERLSDSRAKMSPRFLVAQMRDVFLRPVAIKDVRTWSHAPQNTALGAAAAAAKRG